MANTIIGAGAKKETVYNGPSPQAKQGTVYNGPASATSGGTVYGGPGTGGTVYAPSRQVAASAASGTHPAAAKGAGILFAIAIFSAINTALIMAGSPIVLGRGLTTSKIAGDGMTAVVVLNILVVGVFVMLGIFARAGSKAALVIGMLLYGGDTALLLLAGNPALHVAGLVVHVILLVGLFKAFSQLQD